MVNGTEIQGEGADKSKTTPPVEQELTVETPPPGSTGNSLMDEIIVSTGGPVGPSRTETEGETPPQGQEDPAKKTATEVQLTATDGQPDESDENALFGPAEPPPGTAADRTPPAAETGDKLAGVIDPALKATVLDKITKVSTHIENGAALLKQGKVEETVNAYRAAADLVSPEEQKQFLTEQKRIAQLIKDETAKPQDQQDAQKLEQMKVLERQLRTLGLVDMFTETNSGLIYTQAGDMTKAGECFARAFLNEKAMVDEKLLPPEGYLSKEPNLGARVNEISQRVGVNIWKLMADSVQRAGVDPRLVGIDTGRGPPVRAESDQPPTDQPPADQPPTGQPTDRSPTGQPTETGQPQESGSEAALEQPITFSPTDNAGRTPLERVGFWLDKAMSEQKLTPEMRTEIEKAIADADKGRSPKLQDLIKKEAELEDQKETMLDARVGNTQETVRDVVIRINRDVLGTFEEKQVGDETQIVKTKEGLIDKFVPPADWKVPDEIAGEIANASPPEEYKASAAKPADFTGSDEDWRIQNFRTDLKNNVYRQEVKKAYASLDEAFSEEQYKATLEVLKKVAPENKQWQDALTERDQVSTQVRTVLLQLNHTSARIPAEQNQSAMARAMYADLLMQAEEPEAAQKYFTEAYAWNQLPVQTQELRSMAMAAGVDPVTLLDAAVKQNEARGGARNGKALEVENLLQEANLIFMAAPADKKQEVGGQLGPQLEKLQKLSDNEYAQVQARSKTLSEEYEKALPADPALRTELAEVERRLVEAEKKFTPAEIELVAASMDESKKPEERAAARAELEKTQPDWAKDESRFKEIIGDKAGQYIEVQAKIKVHMMDVGKSGENLFYSRAIQANMLNETGNKEGAKAKLMEAFGVIPSAMRTALLEQRPKVAELAQAVGLDVDAAKALPEPAPKEPPAERPPAAQPGGDQPPADQPPADQPPAAQPGDQPAQRPGGDQEGPAALKVKGRENPVPGADPRFANFDDAELEKKIGEKALDLESAEQVKDMYRELIKRYDSDLPKEEFEQSIPAMALLSEALKQGKDLTDGPNRKRIIGSEDLTPERRWDLHRAVFADQESIGNQIRARQEFAQYLKAAGQHKDAEAMGIEARDLSESLLKPHEVDGKTVRVIDLMNQEAAKLIEDLALITDPAKRQQMQVAHIILKGRDVDSGIVKTPINTNKFLAQFYLGTEIVPTLDSSGQPVGIQDIRFGTSSAFKPQLAIDAAHRALQHTRDILKVDPLDANTAKENPGVASLFGALAEIITQPEKYKLYVGKEGETFVDEDGQTRFLKGGELVGKNDAGIPILIEAHSVQNIKNQIKKDSAFDSLLVNAAVAVGMVGIVALSRNPKVLGAFERGFGRFTPHGAKIAKIGGWSTALSAGALGRHYGYKVMTGVDESWTDTAVNVIGSLAAAEVGGRMSGRGSFITGQAAGARQFARFDTKASAEFYAREGYDTTGKLMDLLKSQGFINEAKAFVGLSRETKLFAQAGKLNDDVARALEQANLTGARTGAVAEAIIKDAKLSTGFKHDLVAARLDTQGVKTVGDLERMVRADQEMLGRLSKKMEGVADATKVDDVLKDIAATAEGQQLALIAEKYGLKNAGQVQSLATTVEKIGFDKLFPKLSEMRGGNLINSSTSLSQAVSMGTHVLEGPGLQRLIAIVPAGERAGLMTEKALSEVMSRSAVTGTRTLRQRWDAAVDGTATAWNTVTTRQGWNTMRTAVGETLAPLGTKNFYTGTVPGAIGDSFMWGATKLNSGRRVVTDRLTFRAVDPSKPTPELLSRARHASGIYGALGAAGTYNTLVKPYDMTGQIFGVSLPQIGGDGPHAVYKNEQGNEYTWMEALRESHFPTIEGVNSEALPWYAKPLVPVASAAIGTPGQALFGSFFLKPGAIYKPVWSNPEIGTFRKSMQTFVPLSPTRWNNWNAGLFSGPTMATGGVFAGTAIPSSLDAIGPRLQVGKYKDLLRNATRPIENKELPTQRPDLEEVQDQNRQPGQAPGQQGGDQQPVKRDEREPPPPG